jgi:predicted O-methyltransferase YrrM
VVTRHEFLADLHELLQPRTYLEIGVQHGWSLQLAQPGTRAVGIDPDPLLVADVGTATVVADTSDAFFARDPDYIDHLLAGSVDLAFIDGLHLYEYALRDFINVERWAHPHGVVVFDDVLPRNQHEAARVQCLGDWTGDVWRVEPILRAWRPDLRVRLVDTEPTGVLVAYGLNPASAELAEAYDDILRASPLADVPVPDEVLHRTHAVTAAQGLAEIREWRTSL